MATEQMEWGEVVRLRREALDLTQGQLAKVASVSLKTIGNLESEAVTPQRGTLDKIRDALGLSSDIAIARRQVGGEDVGRLGRYVATRRRALGAEDAAGFSRRVGMTPAMLADLEAGAGDIPTNLWSPLERELKWNAGSVGAILRGGEPERADSTPAMARAQDRASAKWSPKWAHAQADREAVEAVAALMALIPEDRIDEALGAVVQALLPYLRALDALDRPTDLPSDPSATTTQGDHTLVAHELERSIQDEQEEHHRT